MSTPTNDEIIAAVREGLLKLAQAKRVEFGDQAVTHTSADELSKLLDIVRADTAQVAGRLRPRFRVATFDGGASAGRSRPHYWRSPQL